MQSIPRPATRVSENHGKAIERGREIFFRTETNSGDVVDLAARCDSCHRQPTYTDRLKADVGTGGMFDTPHLLDIRSSAPYLHDGRAMTLEEIWTVHSPEDNHGITNDLTKVQLNDLVLFLRSL
jgi:cytochrome c peroxidase